MFSNKIKTNLS